MSRKISQYSDPESEKNRECSQLTSAGNDCWGLSQSEVGGGGRSKGDCDKGCKQQEDHYSLHLAGRELFYEVKSVEV
jgi:hypothetical protein